jgi:hypothetical protein
MERRLTVAVSLLALVASLALAPAALAKSGSGSSKPIAIPGKPIVDASKSVTGPKLVVRQVLTSKGVRNLEVQVKGLPQLAGAELDVFVGGVQAGSLMVRPDGDGKHALPIIAGSPVPRVWSNMPVELRTRAGLLVVSGTLR